MDDRSQEIIDQLRRENEALRAQVTALQEELRSLRERLEEAERAAHRQAAPFRRREKKKVPDGEKKQPGRKKGHPGACRQVPSYVDETIEVPLSECPKCRGPVNNAVPLEQYIEEIVPVRPHVTKLITYDATCPCCGEIYSTHALQTSRAGGAAKVQLGPRALAMAATLKHQHGQTFRTVCAVLKLFGLSSTRGGIAQALQRVAAKAEGDYDRLIDELRSRAAVFADETSWWVGGPGWWLWAFTTPDTTVYRVEKSRSGDVARETLGDDFAGMLVSDCLASYDKLPYRKHKCFAHHQQAITKARDRPDTKDDSYLKQWSLFFKTVAVIASCREHMRPEEYTDRCRAVEASCDRLLAEPRTQPGDIAVQNRLSKQRDHLLGCLYEPAAEPTNNRAERALRPAVIARKLSCGNKTEAGRRCWETLVSLAVTCNQRSQDFIDYLAPRIALRPTG